MLIPDAFLTAEIRETNDFKEYETMFMKVDVPMNQLQPVVSTQGTHRITPSAHRSPTVSASPPETKKRQQIEGKFKPGSHKDNPEVIFDDDDNEREKKDDVMGSLEIRNEETQTTIPTPLSSPRKILSSNKKTFQELTDIVSNLRCAGIKIDDILHEVVPQIAENVTNDLIEANLKPCIVNTIIENRDAFHSEVPDFISQEFKAHAPMKRNLQDRADDIALWEALRRKFEKSSTSNTSCREDDFHSHHDEQEQKDQSLQGDAWEEENVIDEDEVIPEDVTHELIVESHNVDKRVPTIFDHARKEATLRDSLSNMSRNAKEYAFHLEQSTSFMKN
ncbi:hypothetical protein Tco_0873071 [Tanacetum coccineum]